MNIITSIINFLIVLLIGTPTPKNSLHKKPTKNDIYKGLNCWVERNFYIICFISIIFLLITFVLMCFWIVGVSALESGGMRNFINGGLV